MNPRTIPTDAAPSHEARSIDLETLRTLFDLAPDIAFFVKDASGRYVAVNQSLLSRHGLRAPSDALGKRPSDICSGEFGRIPTQQDQQVLRTGKPLVERLELQLHRPRKPVWCLTTKLPLLDVKGRTIGIIGFSRDVRAPVKTDDIPLAFARVVAEFEEDPSVECSPATLAKRARLSLSQFAKVTSRVFGLTPSQFIMKTRISAGSHWLRQTEQSVAVIAQRCGYTDQSAFSRAFRATTGVTPLQYRRRGRLERE